MPDKPFDLNRMVAEATLTRTIQDEDMTIPSGSVVFICRTACADEVAVSEEYPNLYAGVATVAVNHLGIAIGWRLFIPFDAVTVKDSFKLHHVAAKYGNAVAEACEDEAGI
jgi:hypothetical protein